MGKQVTINFDDHMPITSAQLEYIYLLCSETGNDPDNYKLDTMTKYQASKLIGELKKEL